MNPLQILFAPLGFCAGLLAWSRMVYLSYGVYGAIKKTDFREQLKNPADRHASQIVLVLTIASCIWVLTFGTVAFLLKSTANSGWVWFFGGAASTPALIAMTTNRALRRIKERRDQGAQL